MDIFFDNEFRNLIPPLQPDERTQLEHSLKTEGNRVPITIWKETKLLLDGHNRYDICIEAGVELKPAEELSFPDRNAAMVWIIQNQFGRRNLAPYSIIRLRLKLDELLHQKGIENMSRASSESKAMRKEQGFATLQNLVVIPPVERINAVKEVAKASGYSEGTISKVKVIEKKATPEQKAELVTGNATINQIFVAIRRDEVKEHIKTMDFPIGKYRIIYADPPWQYGNSMPEYATTQDDHYSTMSVSEICKLPVIELALDDSVLFLWATSPILEESFDVIRAWGFKYKACFVWDKVKHNMGHYNSVRHEFLLIGVRGSCQPDENKLFDSVQTIERNGHSEKPELFREIINALYPYGPRIELFARRQTEGWEVFGNDIH